MRIIFVAPVYNDWKEAPVWTPETIKEETKSWFTLLSKK